MSLDFEVPTQWGNYISYSFNRVYISPAIGCSANCAYCYIFEFGCPHSPILVDVPAKTIRDWLENQKAFRAGKNGTLISIGSMCDPFAPSVTDKTLEFVSEFAPLGNPIQISTKYYIREDTANKLAGYQAKDGQIVVYGTVTSIQHWKRLEPAADSPLDRLKGLGNVEKTGVKTCISIKPVIPGITETDAELFADAIDTYRISYCAVGVMYSSEIIEKRLKHRGLTNPDLENRFSQHGNRSIPCQTNISDRVTDIDTLDVVRRIISIIKKTQAKIIISGPCAMALSYGVLCPTGVWRYLPHLCTNCPADCKEMFDAADSDIKNVYPNVVEGLKAVDEE
ncbi:MAG: hypothetical protein C0401_09960 [Anaerolinea sp.]|nr:hypothetical protein [Anaerolinea sp.]